MQSNEFSKMTHREFDQTGTGWRKFGDDHKASIKAIFQFALYICLYGSVGEWIKIACLENRNRLIAGRRFESCRFRQFLQHKHKW